MKQRTKSTEKYPRICVRVSKRLRERMDALRNSPEGLSYGQIVSGALHRYLTEKEAAQ